jgi:hypothetical protein
LISKKGLHPTSKGTASMSKFIHIYLYISTNDPERQLTGPTVSPSWKKRPSPPRLSLATPRTSSWFSHVSDRDRGLVLIAVVLGRMLRVMREDWARAICLKAKIASLRWGLAFVDELDLMDLAWSLGFFSLRRKLRIGWWGSRIFRQPGLEHES